MSHWQHLAKITPADREMSLVVRELAGWKCQYRFKCSGNINFKETGNTGGLTNSHFHKRSQRTVRYDERNCDAACRPCHAYVEDTAEGQRALKAWKRKQLGGKVYRDLEICANVTRNFKADDKMELLFVRGLRKQLILEGKLK
jgi:hypothetical protein